MRPRPRASTGSQSSLSCVTVPSLPCNQDWNMHESLCVFFLGKKFPEFRDLEAAVGLECANGSLLAVSCYDVVGAALPPDERLIRVITDIWGFQATQLIKKRLLL